MKIYFREYNLFFVKKLKLNVSNNHGIIQSYIMYRDEINRKLELCLESNVNVTKRARLATFAISIVDIFGLLQPVCTAAV